MHRLILVLLGVYVTLAGCAIKQEVVLSDESIKTYLRQHNAPLNYEIASELVGDGCSTAIVDTFAADGVPYATYTVRYDENGLIEEEAAEVDEEELISHYLYRNGLSDLFVVVDRFDYTDGTHGITIEVDGKTYNVCYDNNGNSVPEPKATAQCHIELSDTESDVLCRALERYLDARHVLIPAEITAYDFESIVMQVLERPIALKITPVGEESVDYVQDDFASLKVTDEEYAQLAEMWIENKADVDASYWRMVVRSKYAMEELFGEPIAVFVDYKGNVKVADTSLGWQVEVPGKEMLTESLLAWKAFNDVKGEITVISVEDGYVDIAIGSQEKRLKLAIGCCCSDSELDVLYLKNMVTWWCELDERVEKEVWEAAYKDLYAGEVVVTGTERDASGLWYKVQFGEKGVRRLCLNTDEVVWDLTQY